MVGTGLIILIFIAAAGYSIALESSKESAQDLEKVKIMLRNEDAAVDWVAVQEAILSMDNSRDADVEETLVQVLRREKEIKLTPDAPLPGVMPPLETLKAASIITLEKMDAKKSIHEIERVYRSTKYQVLRDIALEAIRNLNES